MYACETHSPISSQHIIFVVVGVHVLLQAFPYTTQPIYYNEHMMSPPYLTLPYLTDSLTTLACAIRLPHTNYHHRASFENVPPHTTKTQLASYY